MKTLHSDNNMTMMCAGDIMRRDQPLLTPEMDANEAANLIVEYQLEGACVVDQYGMLMGVVTEKDCIAALIQPLVNRVPLATVGDIMSRDVFSLTEDVSFLTIANVFAHKPYRWLPVVRTGVAVGSVGRREFLSAMTQALRVQPEYRESPLYLSAVDSDVRVAL